MFFPCFSCLHVAACLVALVCTQRRQKRMVRETSSGKIQDLLDDLRWSTLYPLVNVYITIEHHHLLMAKSTISTGPFSSSLFVCLPGRVSGKHRAIGVLSTSSPVGWHFRKTTGSRWSQWGNICQVDIAPYIETEDVLMALRLGWQPLPWNHDEFGSHVGLIAKLRTLIFHNRVNFNNHWVYGRYIWGSKEIPYLDDLGCASQSRFVGMLTSPAKKVGTHSKNWGLINETWWNTYWCVLLREFSGMIHNH